MSNQSETLSLKLALSGLASVQADLRHLAHGLDELKDFAVELAGAFLGVKLGEGMAETAKQVLELGTQLQVLKSKSGATIPELMSIRRLLKDSGESADGAGMLFKRLENAIVEAAEKGGEVEKAFKDIGLDVEKLSAMSPGDAFKATAEGIAHLDNEFKKTNVSISIFGRTGDEVKVMFENLKRVQDAYAASPFKVVMERNAELFHEIEDSLEHLSENGLRMMAGFLDQIAPMFKEAFEAVGQIDLTTVGQNIGAFFGVIIQSWKDGKFPEMIGLLIEAGFELGVSQSKKVWAGFWESLTGQSAGQFYMALINAIMTFGVRAAQILVEALFYPVAGLAASFDYLWVQLKVGFNAVGNFMKDIFADALNAFIKGWNATVGKITHNMIAPVAFEHSTVKGASWEESWNAAKEAASGYGVKVVDFLDEQLKKSREILGINQNLNATDNTRATALQRFSALMDDYKRKIAEANHESEGEHGANSQLVFAKRVTDLLELENRGRTMLTEIQTQIANVNNDFTKTAAEKWTERQVLLQQEKSTLEGVIELMRKRAEMESQRGNAVVAANLRKSADTEQAKLPGIGTKEGPNPYSFTEQFSATVTSLFDQFGTLAQQTAGLFKTTFNSAVSSIGSGITGLIMRTKTWGQALREIGTNILTTVIQAIVEMGVRWVLTHVIIRGAMAATHAIGQALKASDTASTISNETAKAPVIAINAANTSTTSYGAASIIGAAAAVAAIGLVVAAAMGAFDVGGYTGSGGRGDVAGVVHGQEFVMRASAVDRIGLPALDAMNSGASPSAVGGSDGQVHIHQWWSERDMMRFITTHPEFKHQTVRLMQENSHAIVRR